MSQSPTAGIPAIVQRLAKLIQEHPGETHAYYASVLCLSRPYVSSLIKEYGFMPTKTSSGIRRYSEERKGRQQPFRRDPQPLVDVICSVCLKRFKLSYGDWKPRYDSRQNYYCSRKCSDIGASKMAATAGRIPAFPNAKQVGLFG